MHLSYRNATTPLRICSRQLRNGLHEARTVKRMATQTDNKTPYTSTPSVNDDSMCLDKALVFARLERFDEARDAFTQYLSKQPHSCRVWVMWAQMEKRAEARGNAGSSFCAREVLQKGLEINKDSACLISAWGLTELKRGNLYAAKAMLERAAEIDASVLPVLRWERVREAVVRLDTLRRHKKSQLL